MKKSASKIIPKYINPKLKTGVYIDAANIFYASQTLNYKIDFEKLINFFDKKFNVRQVSYYTGYDPENKGQLKFLAKLDEFGYRVIRKPVKRINTSKKTIEKANVDVELAIDAIEEADLYENIILASGDSDFGYLVKTLKEKGKTVIVLSARGHISRELIQLSDYYLPLEKLENEIKL